MALEGLIEQSQWNHQTQTQITIHYIRVRASFISEVNMLYSSRAFFTFILPRVEKLIFVIAGMDRIVRRIS